MKMGKQGAAGVSPTPASPATILNVDLLGTAFVLQEFGNVIGCSGRRSRAAAEPGTLGPKMQKGEHDAQRTGGT